MSQIVYYISVLDKSIYTGDMQSGDRVATQDEIESWLNPELARMAEIKLELQNLDTAKVRPMSAILDGTATEDEQVRLAELNAKSDDLRAELHMLEFAEMG